MIPNPLFAHMNVLYFLLFVLRNSINFKPRKLLLNFFYQIQRSENFLLLPNFIIKIKIWDEKYDLLDLFSYFRFSDGEKTSCCAV